MIIFCSDKSSNNIIYLRSSMLEDAVCHKEKSQHFPRIEEQWAGWGAGLSVASDGASSRKLWRETEFPQTLYISWMEINPRMFEVQGCDEIFLADYLIDYVRKTLDIFNTLFRLHFCTKRIKDSETSKINLSDHPCFSHFTQKSLCCCTLDTWDCRTACDWSHAAPGWARCHWGYRGWQGRSGWTPRRLCTPRSSCSHNTQLEIRFYLEFEYFRLLFTYEIVIIDVNYSPMLWVPQSILDATKLHEAFLVL